MSDHQLDARRILCPLPVIRTQDAIAKLAPGDVLVVTATDPGVAFDIPAWCKVHGHQVLAIEEDADEIRVTVRVGEP
jgi:tRNA 2-thiouridine synthesizing protein A